MGINVYAIKLQWKVVILTYMATTVDSHQFRSVVCQLEPNSMPHLSVQRTQSAPNQLSSNIQLDQHEMSSSRLRLETLWNEKENKYGLSHEAVVSRGFTVGQRIPSMDDKSNQGNRFRFVL